MSSSTSAHARGTASLALLSGEKLERRLEELLHQDRFAPPTHFVASERVDDASLHALQARYPVYRARPPKGPLLKLRPERVLSWRAAG